VFLVISILYGSRRTAAAAAYSQLVCYVIVRLQVVRVEPAPDSQLGSGGGISALVLPEPEAICDAPDWAKPNRSWVQQFVADFQELRQQAQQAYEQQCEFHRRFAW
jgi:hypothetical protein